MRKLLLITLLFLNSFAQAQFGWSGLSSNQWVSFQDIQGSGLRQIQPPLTIPKWMTKADVLNMYDVDTSSLSSLLSNQWITKAQAISHSIEGYLFWTFTIPYPMDGAYMDIFINGTRVLHATDNTTLASTTVSDGDVVNVIVHTSDSDVNGENSTVNIYGSNGLSYLVMG